MASRPQLRAVPSEGPSAQIDSIEYVAANLPRLLELLEGASASVDDLVPIRDGQLFATTEQLARRYGVEPRWIRARAAKLGGVRLSDASNSKLRYDVRIADAYLESQRLPPPKVPTRKAARRLGGRSGADRVPFV